MQVRKAFEALVFIMVLAGCNRQWEFGAPTSPVKMDATYKSIYTQIIQPYCLSCHSKELHKGRLDLTTYEGLMKKKGVIDKENLNDPLTSSFYARMMLKPDDDEFMPQNGKPIKPEMLDMVKQWILQGAKE